MYLEPWSKLGCSETGKHTRYKVVLEIPNQKNKTEYRKTRAGAEQWAKKQTTGVVSIFETHDARGGARHQVDRANWRLVFKKEGKKDV